METITDLGDQLIRKILNKIETERQVPSDGFQGVTYSKFCQTFKMERFSKIVNSF